MNTHTPGPWIKDRNLITDQDGQDIATVTYHQNGYVQANARLIAAAPDLLKAAKLALDALTTVYDKGRGIVKAELALHAFGNLKTAIEKAEGREGE